MSYVIAAPETMAAAATDLATIGATLDEAHQATAPTTVALTPAAADEVSQGIAQLFSQHAQGYQAVAGQAAVHQDQFVQNLKSGAASYTTAENAAASLLNPLSGPLANLQFFLSEIPYALANLDEFLPYIASLLVLYPIVLPFVALVVAIGVVQAIIETFTSLLGSI